MTKNRQTKAHTDMKKRILAALLALAAIVCSCTINEDPESSQGGLSDDGTIVSNPTATIEPFILDDGTEQ